MRGFSRVRDRQAQPRHATRCDRRQRLAAKSERRDSFEIGKARDLAGRMARERERQFVAGDAAAVVGDHDAARATAVELDIDAAWLPRRARFRAVP